MSAMMTAITSDVDVGPMQLHNAARQSHQLPEDKCLYRGVLTDRRLSKQPVELPFIQLSRCGGGGGGGGDALWISITNLETPAACHAVSFLYH